MTSDGVGVRSGPAAAAAAGITYRQLDYWARRGWVTPSQITVVSSGRRVRSYTPLEVARLAALRHLARSGHDIAAHGPAVGVLDLHADELMVVSGTSDQLQLIPADELLGVVTGAGTWTVFDPTPFLIDDATARDQPSATRITDATVIVRSA